MSNGVEDIEAEHIVRVFEAAGTAQFDGISWHIRLNQLIDGNHLSILILWVRMV